MSPFLPSLGCLEVTRPYFRVYTRTAAESTEGQRQSIPDPRAAARSSAEPLQDHNSINPVTEPRAGNSRISRMEAQLPAYTDIGFQ
jgi:hypothetical protein